ncbi:alpha/beta hydrolase domain-containing protein [Muricoccus nepalensis]|uniref:alpha/beta hydrolase domain-containing protein n=1 Tax=Muricoccus nepalensis TaxID=1854500 RepID=UPI0018833BA0|nr:alpha/beta hydrolase domain-containing protein [Roseomonas nepalensis]
MGYSRLGNRAGFLMALLAGLGVLELPDAAARVARITIDQTEPVGGTIPQLRLSGRAFGELDPQDPTNAIITDLRLAPRNASGHVEYVARFSLTKPADMARASGVLWYDLVNRGAPVELGEGATSPGDFGHVALISGWQGDLAQTERNWAVQVPTATNPDGSPITGPVIARMADSRPGTRSRPLVVLGAAVPYDAASLDTARARLVTKASETRTGQVGGVREVPSSDFSFADCTSTPFPGTPNPRMLCLRDGFDPALLYELTYEARDPKVLGVGLAAMRDVAAFFRYEVQDDNGTVNPVAGRITHAVTQGISQSGNALKTFLHLGFNRDEAGRRVFDGANPHIAGRLTAVNVRFGIPSGSGTLYEPGGEGVLWWERTEDTARGRTAAGLLDRCRTTDTCPQIFETFGATEFNARLMTAALTGTSGGRDLPLPSNVRRYYFPGTTHDGDKKGGFSPAPVSAPGCIMPRNPNPETETMNALQVALVEWVVRGTEPPPSAYPTLREGQLAVNTAEAMGFPHIPGAARPDGMAVGVMDYDFGAELNYNDFSGIITRQPPGIRGIIPAVMPKVNADGNETAGVPSVLHQAPLGTYTGWNVVAGGFFRGQPCGGGLTGGYIPFARTLADREASGDPRPSLTERYGSQEGYLCAVRAAVRHDVAARFLLRADGDRLMRQASASRNLPDAAADEAGRAVTERLCRG